MDAHMTNCRLFAAATGASVWQFINELAAHGPSWSLVPPIVLSVATVIGAVKNYLDGAQARRHADERHRAEMEALKRRAFDPMGGFEALGRN